jgi:hypothetical protein
MSFDTIRNGLTGLLNGLGYAESDSGSFVNAPAVEFGNTFILTPRAGEATTGTETISDRFYDFQTWSIQVAYDKSEQSDSINQDNVHRKKDELLKTLDKPLNWESYARIQKYKSWVISEEKSYYILNIEISIIDEYVY